jgi:hypothetical protein
LLDAILQGQKGKPIMNISTQTLPGDYFQSGEINLKKNKRLAILLNIAIFFLRFLNTSIIFTISSVTTT